MRFRKNKSLIYNHLKIAILRHPCIYFKNKKFKKQEQNTFFVKKISTKFALAFKSK